MVIIIIVIIVIGGSVGYLIYSQSSQKSTTTIPVCTSCIGEPVSAALYQNLTGVSTSTLATIGTGHGVTNPTAISGTALTQNGKPEVLYIGAEYCPFCAAERWAMIVALSKFGTFSNLTLMLSSPTDSTGIDNVATFSFVNSTYTSSYISFVAVEADDRSGNPLQTVPAADSTLESSYDSAGSIPFIDIGNSYSVVGAQYSPDVLYVGDSLSGTQYNWTQIASQLNNPSSSIAKAIDGTANTLITAICKITSGNPSSVCSASYANLSLAILPGFSGQQTSPIISVIVSNRLELPTTSLLFRNA